MREYGKDKIQHAQKAQPRGGAVAFFVSARAPAVKGRDFKQPQRAGRCTKGLARAQPALLWFAPVTKIMRVIGKGRRH